MINENIDNYKDLLFAIFNSDNESPKKSFICVYDTKNNDKLIAIFNNAENCAKFFNTTREAIYSTISKKILKLRRYKIERVKKDYEI